MSSLSKRNLNEIADIYSSIQNPKTNQENLTESVEVISEEALDGAALIVLSTLAEHLIENKLAEDFEDCFKIFEHMSDEWLEQILDEKLEATCNLLEEELKEELVLLEGDRDMAGLGILTNVIGGGINLAKQGWRLGGQALSKGRQAAGFVKRTVAKDLRRNYNIPAGQSIAKELSKRAVTNTSRVTTGALRRGGEAIRSGVKAGRDVVDYGGKVTQRLGIGDKPRTKLPFIGNLHLRRKAWTTGLLSGAAVTADKVWNQGRVTKAVQDYASATADAIKKSQQQPKPKETKPQPSKDDNKKKDWLEMLNGEKNGKN